ncbi:hypothetical protein AMS68_004950 [Peltaster fructicola]|uniref:Ubiquinol-cytochrome C reductase hinge domain-containing protein n=1 Tax=Peltaster fructicola TaxID=286661 RepID=A0A6H0XXF2_9PEZI|nr:hypothetical protein AMS68_004950 [Peltaster fructicola]
MGFFDYVADLYSAISATEVEAEERQYSQGPTDKSGQQSDSNDTRQGGVGTAEHDRDATTRGGVSTKTPHAGTDEESAEEKEVNTADAEKANSRTASSDGDADVSRGDKAAPSTDDDEEDAEEGKRRNEDEPSDPKPKLEEECLKSSQCHSYKHHYDECAERVQQQIDENGKASEDCVEEYFHMMHCATQCSAAKLFKQLR